MQPRHPLPPRPASLHRYATAARRPGSIIAARCRRGRTPGPALIELNLGTAEQRTGTGEVEIEVAGLGEVAGEIKSEGKAGIADDGADVLGEGAVPGKVEDEVEGAK